MKRNDTMDGDQYGLMKQRLKALQNISRNTWVTLGVLCFAVVGTVLLVSSHAATPTTAFEAESGTRSGSVTVVSDASASGSSAVKFSASVATTGFPDSTNTGHIVAGYTNLTQKPAGWHITASGTYTSFEVPGQMYIDADNVTIKGCYVHGHTGDVLILVSGKNATIQDCTIAGDSNATATSPETGWIETYADGLTVQRCNFYNSSGDGIRIGETSNVTLQDNYLHDWVQNPTNEPHDDGIVVGSKGGANILVRHNTVLMWSPGHMSNTISLAVDVGAPIGPYTVDNNLLAGGGYTIHGGGNTNYTGIVFSNNKFSTQFSSAVGDYGIMTISPVWGTRGSSWTNNTYYDGPKAGQVIPAP